MYNIIVCSSVNVYLTESKSCFSFPYFSCFEVYPDPVMQEVTHFRLPGLLPILKNTVQFVNEVRGHPKSHISICGIYVFGMKSNINQCACYSHDNFIGINLSMLRSPIPPDDKSPAGTSSSPVNSQLKNLD